MKKITLLLLLLTFSFNANSQSTINITTSGGSYATEKWVDVTTEVNGAGTQIWAQGDGTYGNGSGLINQDIDLPPGTYYVNCYDQYSDGWDGTLISVTAYGAVIGDNGGVSPSDSSTNDTGSSWETPDVEIEASFMIVVPNPPSCAPPSSLTATANSTTDVDISWTAGGTETEWTYEFGPTGFTQGSLTPVTVSNNTINLNGLTASETYDIYVQANCGGTDGSSTWSTISWTMPIAGDTFATATTLPFTISEDGTGCATSNFSIDFPNSGFTASGLLGNGTPGNEGIDAFFNWTATTDALRYWGAGAGAPYIGIHDASGTEIAYSTYAQEDLVLSGWAVGDELVIRFYDYGTSNVLVDFCLEYYTLPAAPNCAENLSPTGSDVSFNNAAVSLSWDVPSSGPTPTAYEIFWGLTSGNLTSIGVLDAPATGANITGIFYGETYYYSVVPRNGASSAIGCTENSLTVENASAPFNTDFTNYPAGFSESSGPFGSPSATVTSSDWVTADFLNDATLGKGAKVNIWGTGKDEYLISPTFDLSSGSHYLNINAGITDWNGTVADPDGMDVGDDYVAIVLSEDDGATWSELYRWDSTSGLTEVSQAMPEVTLSTTSTTAKIALYAFSGVGGGDYDFHITNLQITTETLGTATNILEGFTLYPTIVKEELNFRSQNKVEAITVFNLLGQKVFSGAPNANNSSVNLSTLRPGVYIVKVSAEGNIGSYKIIKE